MAVGEIEIRMLQERRHREQDIGVIGRVGLELFQHTVNRSAAAFPGAPRF